MRFLTSIEVRVGLLAIATVTLVKAGALAWAWSNETGGFHIDLFPPDDWGPVEMWIYTAVATVAVVAVRFLEWLDGYSNRPVAQRSPAKNDWVDMPLPDAWARATLSGKIAMVGTGIAAVLAGAFYLGLIGPYVAMGLMGVLMPTHLGAWLVVRLSEMRRERRRKQRGPWLDCVEATKPPPPQP